MLHFF